MNTETTLNEMISKGIWTAGDRWRLMPDKLAEGIRRAFIAEGYRVRTSYHDGDDRENGHIDVTFLAGEDTAPFGTLVLALDDDEEYEDGISSTFDRIPVRRDETIWSWLRNAYDKLVQLVRNVAYDGFVRAMHAPDDIKRIHGIYAERMLRTRFGAAKDSMLIPTFEEWAKSTNWGTGTFPKDVTEFVRYEYLDDDAPWNDFPLEWMSAVRKADIGMNLKVAALAADDGEWI